MVPVEVPQRRGEPVVVARDKGPRPVTLEELAAAKPYFKRDGGTITTANASTLNDGAAAVLLASEERAAELVLEPLAEIVAYHNVGVERALMGEGAFKVIPPLLKRAGVDLPAVDFFEINEAFGAVVAAAYHFLPGLKPSAPTSGAAASTSGTRWAVRVRARSWTWFTSYGRGTPRSASPAGASAAAWAAARCSGGGSRLRRPDVRIPGDGQEPRRA